MESLISRLGLEGQLWVDPIIGLIIFGIAILASVLSHYVIIPLAQRLSRHTETELDDRIFQSVRRPASLIIMVLGSYLAVVIPTDLTAGQQHVVNALFTAAAILAVLVLIARLLSVSLDWYISQMSMDQRSASAHIVPILRRVAIILVYAIGVMLILDVLGISIGPLIASLSLGGLAVALAIQPTLANVFAGTYVATENVISPGDYIELEGGIAGYVIEVSLRSTRIRTWENQLVVIPNSRLADTIVTNYSEPTPPINVFLTCRVSYNSDLDRVEAVSRDAMTRVLEESPHGVKDYGSYFAFDTFGESNVDFWLFVQAKDRLASFELRSELINELHRRFAAEGIVINYPVRSLQFPNGAWPQGDRRPGVPQAIVRRRVAEDAPSVDIAGDSPDGPGSPDGPDGPG